jgi:hypothetical protein
MIDNCPICGNPRQHVTVIDIAELRVRLYQAHCMETTCEEFARTFTYMTKRDGAYDLDRIAKLQELSKRMDTLNLISNRVVKARQNYERGHLTTKGPSKAAGKRWEDLLAQLTEHYNDVCAWAAEYAVMTPPLPEGMRQ